MAFVFNLLVFAPALAPTFAPSTVPSTANGQSTTLQPAGAAALLANPPATAITTASQASLAKLSPDLRQMLSSDEHLTFRVVALTKTSAAWQPYLKNPLVRKSQNDLQWLTGEAGPLDLIKLASLPETVSVTSLDSYVTEASPLEKSSVQGHRLTLNELAPSSQSLDKTTLTRKLEKLEPARPFIKRETTSPQAAKPNPALNDVFHVKSVHENGLKGDGVVTAIVDSGVDFAHADLANTYARIPSGPYAGWPFVYDTVSGDSYASAPTATIGPDTYWNHTQRSWYTHTLPVTGLRTDYPANAYSASLKLDYGSDAGWSWSPVVLPFTLPNTSKSNTYYYTVHPDFALLAAGYYLGLGYARDYLVPPAVLLVDETQAGEYDTVYVDLNFNQNFTDDKPMRRGSETAGYDVLGDGAWDVSAGTLAWISDGLNPPPGTSTLFAAPAVPARSRFISFFGDSATSGTQAASVIAAQSKINDPEAWGPANTLIAGGSRGPVLSSVAPNTRIAAFAHGQELPFDAWTLATLGFDGKPESGDEAQIVVSPWNKRGGGSEAWNATGRFAQWLNSNVAGHTTFVAPSGLGSTISVGASSSFGSVSTSRASANQLTWGNLWPANTPTLPDLTALGGLIAAATPLNMYYGSAQVAYDVANGSGIASAVAAGHLALVEQAYKQQFKVWPTADQAKAILTNGARDLGYDVTNQGAGETDAHAAAEITSGNDCWAQPGQWHALVTAGQSISTTFTMHNPASHDIAIVIGDSTLAPTKELTYTATIPADFAKNASPNQPLWLADLTSSVRSLNPDLVRAQVTLTPAANTTDNWQAVFYDWVRPANGGSLWQDQNKNGLVEAIELQNTTTYPILSVANADRGTVEALVGRDSLSRLHDGLFFGLQKTAASETSAAAKEAPQSTQIEVHLTVYKKQGWDWLSPSVVGLTINPGNISSFGARFTPPANTAPGRYTGAIEITVGQRVRVLPVIMDVVAPSPTFEIQAQASAQAGQPNNQYFFANSANEGRAVAIDVNPLGGTTSVSSPSVIYREGFDTVFPPNGWRLSSQATIGHTWQRQTNAYGSWAVADSGQACDGNAWDSTLTSTQISLPAAANLRLAYQSDFQVFAADGEAWLDISDNNGASWTNLTHWTTDRRFTPRNGGENASEDPSETVDLSAYANRSVRLRWRYADNASGCAGHWRITNVAIYAGAEPSTTIAAVQPVELSVLPSSPATPPDAQTFASLVGRPLVTLQPAGQSSYAGLSSSASLSNSDLSTSAQRLPAGTAVMTWPSVDRTGRAFQVQTTPARVDASAQSVPGPSANRFAGSWTQTFTTTAMIENGLSVAAYGFAQPLVMNNVALEKPSDTTCGWSHTFSVKSGARIEAIVTSDDLADLDMRLYKGSQQIASSLSAGAQESITVAFPQDGEYLLCVSSATGQAGHFNLTLRVYQGSDIWISDIPQGMLPANSPFSFTVNYDRAFKTPGDWEALLFVGPPSAPAALCVPITLHVTAP